MDQDQLEQQLAQAEARIGRLAPAEEVDQLLAQEEARLGQALRAAPAEELEQLLAQEEERIRQEAQVREANAVCNICGRNGFKGERGVQIHQRKNAACREMRIQQEAIAAALAARGMAEEVEAIAVEEAEVAVAEDVVAEDQGQVQAQPGSIIGRGWALTKEITWAFFKFIKWILKIIYSLMIMILGLTNIYFVYLYWTEQTPVTQKTTYLLSPNFEEEFKVM